MHAHVIRLVSDHFSESHGWCMHLEATPLTGTTHLLDLIIDRSVEIVFCSSRVLWLTQSGRRRHPELWRTLYVRFVPWNKYSSLQWALRSL